jgi:outer membrane protein OmpA-like peptidoglycan-associated protein
MRAFLPGLCLFALFFIFGRWYFVCETRGHCGEQEEQISLPERPEDLYLLDDKDTIVGRPFQQFLFPPNTIKPDMNASNQAFLDKVVDFLAENPDRKIMLTGRFSESEKSANSGFFENIGIARAAYFETLLEKHDIDQKQIETGGLESSDVEMKYPLLFTVLPKEAHDTFDIPQYRFEDNTFSNSNFKSNSAELTPGTQLEVYADSVKLFLKENPNYVLTITGHTDSLGTEEHNMILGMSRAISAKTYFEGLGISTPINTVSMGKTQYAAPNSNVDGTDNEIGRQKNRRVNFKLATQEQ